MQKNNLSVHKFRTFIDRVLVPMVGTGTYVKTMSESCARKEVGARSLRNTKGTQIYCSCADRWHQAKGAWKYT
jgi:hypothetical protein